MPIYTNRSHFGGGSHIIPELDLATGTVVLIRAEEGLDDDDEGKN